MLIEDLHVFVDEAGVVQEHRETVELPLGRQVAVDQEVGGLHEGGVLGQLVHGNAAVPEDALFPVHEGDGALATAGVDVAGVQRDQAGLRPKIGDVDGLFSFGTDDEGQFVGGAIEDQGDGFGHALFLSGFEMRRIACSGRGTRTPGGG